MSFHAEEAGKYFGSIFLIINFNYMKKMSKVVHFEIPAGDLERAKKFYQDAFGWQLDDQPGMEYVLAKTVETDEKMMPKEAGGINGGMMKRNDMVKSPSFAINVENIDEAMRDVKMAGGTVLSAKMPVGEMGLMAYFKDSEDNVLSLWQAISGK